MKKLIVAALLLQSLVVEGMHPEHQEEVSQEEKSRIRHSYCVNQILPFIRSFAETCARREHKVVVDIRELAKQGRGNQNGGIFEILTKEAEEGHRYVVKVGKFNEFFSACEFYRICEKRGIIFCPEVQFSFPRYMQRLEREDSEEDVLLAREGDPTEDPEKCVCSVRRVGWLKKSDIFSYTSLPHRREWERWENPYEPNTLLFMDKASGLPWGRLRYDGFFTCSLSQRETIFRNLALAANSLYEVAVPDDLDNANNFIINPETGVITYIDADMLHLFNSSDGKYYPIVSSMPQRGRDFEWYFHCVLDEGTDFLLQDIFLRILRPELLPYAKASFSIRIPYTNTNCYNLEYSIDEVERKLGRSSRYRCGDVLKIGKREDLSFLQKIVPMARTFLFVPNKQEQLAIAKKHARSTKMILEKYQGMFSLMELKYVEVGSWNEYFIGISEMAAIEIAPLPKETKKALRVVFQNNIAKPVLYLLLEDRTPDIQELFQTWGGPSEDLVPLARAYKNFRERFVTLCEDDSLIGRRILRANVLFTLN